MRMVGWGDDRCGGDLHTHELHSHNYTYAYTYQRERNNKHTHTQSGGETQLLALPQGGVITTYEPPSGNGIRVDSFAYAGCTYTIL